MQSQSQNRPRSTRSSRRKTNVSYLLAPSWPSWIILLSILIVGHQSAFPNAAAPTKYRIVGYVGGKTNIYAIGVEKLTHVNYAFATVTPDGNVVLRNPDAPGNLAQLQALKARSPALKVIISIGGWGADNFSDAALTDASREKFAASALDMLKRYALDGIDLDWEYPGQPGPGIKFRPEDKQNFTLLLKTLREHLDDLSQTRGRTGNNRYTLTIASSDGEYFDHTEMDKLHIYLDWINVMTYDLYNIATPTTGHHTGLYPSTSGPANQRCTETAIKQHLAAGIPASKLVIGAAFYGRGWTDVNPTNNGLYQQGRFVQAYSYAELQAKYINQNGFKRLWDDQAKAPYLWNPATKSLITYDDPESLKAKAEYVRSHQLGGIMYWEHSNDPGESLLNAIAVSLK